MIPFLLFLVAWALVMTAIVTWRIVAFFTFRLADRYRWTGELTADVGMTFYVLAMMLIIGLFIRLI